MKPRVLFTGAEVPSRRCTTGAQKARRQSRRTAWRSSARSVSGRRSRVAPVVTSASAGIETWAPRETSDCGGWPWLDDVTARVTAQRHLAASASLRVYARGLCWVSRLRAAQPRPSNSCHPRVTRVFYSTGLGGDPDRADAARRREPRLQRTNCSPQEPKSRRPSDARSIKRSRITPTFAHKGDSRRAPPLVW